LKLTSLPRVFCLVSILLFSYVSFAQTVPATGGSRDASLPSTYEVFFGGSTLRSAGQYNEGWGASLSEYPYKAYPWIGGTVDASAHYSSENEVSSQTYTAMFGPSVVLKGHTLQPFARVMLGGVVGHSSSNVLGGSYSATEHYFGMAVGGGVDIAIGHKCAIRGQADYVPVWYQAYRNDMFKAELGLVTRF
jgi:hypothetical protein